MQIIKINKNSYKIILSREDLERECGSGQLSSELINEILEKTYALYGHEFDAGAIDADFFESRDGSGELFISQNCKKGDNTYLFETDEFEKLAVLSKRLKKSKFQSALYATESVFYLILKPLCDTELILPILKEYGKADKICCFKTWIIQEHAKTICESCALEMLLSF